MSINNLKRGRVSQFTFYADPGHGWLKVPRHYLTALNIEHKISSCSYQLGTNVYLEEDCDAARFIDAFIADQGHKPKYVSKHTNNESKIRSYPDYNPNSLPLESSDIYPGMPVIIYGIRYIVNRKANTKGTWLVRLAGDEYGSLFRVKTNQMEAFIGETK